MNYIWDLRQYSNNKALADDHGLILSYLLLHEEAEILAEAVGRRCLVFCLCKNEGGALLGYVSFLNHGIVPVMLDAKISMELLSSLLTAYCPSFIWLPKSRRDIILDFETVYEKYDYLLLRTNYDKAFSLNEELALLLSTSGSTGSPKLVRQSYDNILENAKSISEYLNLDESERPISTLPMNYTYGLSIINSHLLVGATIILSEKSIMQKEFWDFFRDMKATSFGGVPYTYEMLDKLKFVRMELPFLRTMTQAGGKLSPDLHEKFAKYAEENNKSFIVMYGQCEATARMGYLPAEKAVEKKGSMGIAIPGGRLYLIDENKEEIKAPYTEGELVYEGRNVTLGYAECGGDLIKGDERHGILETGDMAWFDEDGFYYIVGRKKRFLKIFGNRVNLDEVEMMIKNKYNIEVACAGVDDSMKIFINEKKPVDVIKKYVSTQTGLNQKAFSVIEIDNIPKNEAGKIQYRLLNDYKG